MCVLEGQEGRFHLQLSTNDLGIKSAALKLLLDVCFISTEQGRAPSFVLVFYVRRENLTLSCTLLHTGFHGYVPCHCLWLHGAAAWQKPPQQGQSCFAFSESHHTNY